jgi:hypothetical protein
LAESNIKFDSAGFIVDLPFLFHCFHFEGGLEPEEFPSLNDLLSYGGLEPLIGIGIIGLTGVVFQGGGLNC